MTDLVVKRQQEPPDLQSPFDDNPLSSSSGAATPESDSKATPFKRQKISSYEHSPSLDRASSLRCSASTADSSDASLVIPPETDPELIASLWDMVSMPKSKGVGSTNTRKSNRLQHINSTKISEIPTTVPPTNEASTVDIQTKQRKAASPYDRDFRDRILKPRFIEIVPREMGPGPAIPHEHFEVDEPPQYDSLAQFYSATREAGNATLWLETNPDIIRGITFRYDDLMTRQGYEAEFAALGHECLLKVAVPESILVRDGRHWTVVRCIQLTTKLSDLGNCVWSRPPLVGLDDNNSDRNYDFELRPDCSYWISLQGFNPSYRDQIDFFTYVHQEKFTCPYFTVEFKKDNSSIVCAQNQVASAGSIALYNRYCLRKRRLKESKKCWTQTRIRHLRHYGLTMDGKEYNVWCITPNISPSDWSWNGCRMHHLDKGYCITAASVRILMLWINEIHCWGLTIHARSCEKDIKVCMREHKARSRFSVSDVSDGSEMESCST